MQFKNNLALTAQETYSAKLAISTGNYETKMAKAIQRKLLDRMFNAPEITVARPLAAYAMDTRCVKVKCDSASSLEGIDRTDYMDQFGESAGVPVLTCQFVVSHDVVNSFDIAPDCVAALREFIAHMKRLELAKHLTAEMACMIDTGAVAYFDCVESYISEIGDGGKIVTFNVVPVYSIN